MRQPRRLTVVAVLAVILMLAAGAAWQATQKVPPSGDRPPIPIQFHLDQPAYITLVIDRIPSTLDETKQGIRVKNLVSNVWFSAGDHTVWWDGLDETNASNVNILGQGEFDDIQGNLIQPGEFVVRGLVRQAITPRYEFAVYSGGQSPPWKTIDGSGGWLADHTPPSAALYLPGSNGVGDRVLVSSSVTEAGDGLVWCDLDGRRISGTRSIGAGEGWGGAEFLARDVGTATIPKLEAYLAGVWFNRAEVWAIGANQKLYSYNFSDSKDAAVGGIAARNGLVVLTLPKLNQMLLVNAATGALLDQVAIDSPRGGAFDPTGRLLVLSGTMLTTWQVLSAGSSPKFASLGTLGITFEDPQGIAIDGDGRIYVSDWGQSHQVKVYSSDGFLIRTIGKPGPPSVGKYDPNHMNQPRGLAVASDGRLWVAENWLSPKRVSIWDSQGALVKAMYGPTWYGGGGSLDPRDSTRFSVHGGGGGMEFHLDWAQGSAELDNIYYLPGQNGVAPLNVTHNSFPQTPVWVGDRLYLTDAYATGPVVGEPAIMLWQYRDGVAVPVAAFGDAASWALLSTEPFRSKWPPGMSPSVGKGGLVMFAWSDIDDDGQVQPDEVQMLPGTVGSVTLDQELGFTTSTAVRYTPVSYSPKGAPIYDLARGPTLAPGGRPSTQRDGGGQVIAAREGWTIFTYPPAPLAPAYLAGSRDGSLNWTYPDEYLGLHAAAFSKPPHSPGEIIGTTRLLGPSFVAPGDSNIELWAINGDYGNVYLFTTDGLHVATLFQDARIAPPWPNEERRGMDASNYSLGQEAFFPSIQRMANGKVYLVGGQPFSGIFEITGLETLHRLPEHRLTITEDQVAAARRYAETHTKQPVPAGPSKALTYNLTSTKTGLNAEAAFQRLSQEILTMVLSPTAPCSARTWILRASRSRS
jgi:sugar lactone lactonase YvrE